MIQWSAERSLVTRSCPGSFILPGIYSIYSPDLIPASDRSSQIVLNCREVFLPRSNKSWKTKLCVGMKLPELIPGRIKYHYWNLARLTAINIIKVNPVRSDHHHLVTNALILCPGSTQLPIPCAGAAARLSLLNIIHRVSDIVHNSPGLAWLGGGGEL